MSERNIRMADWELFMQEVAATVRVAKHSPNDAANDLDGYVSPSWAALHAAIVVRELSREGYESKNTKLLENADGFIAALRKVV